MPAEVRIIKLTKERNKYIIETNIGKYNIDEETILKYQVFKEHEFTRSEFNKILNEVKVNQVFSKTLNFLSYRMRSIYEIKEYLNKNDLIGNEVDIIITKLISIGYLDDKKFSKHIFDYYSRNNKGPKYIENKLLEKKVSKNIINKILVSYNDNMQQEIILKIIDKERNRLKTYPIKSQKQRLINKLIRNGFTSEMVFSIINSVQLKDESDSRLEKDYQRQLNKFLNKNLKRAVMNQKILTNLLKKGYQYQKIKSLLE